MARSNPDSTPASMQREERGGAVYKRIRGSDTTYYIKEASIYVNQNACGNLFTDVSPDSLGDEAVGYWHTHPNAPNDTVYGCPGGAQSPSDTLPPGIAQDVLSYGGGSPEDWQKADSSTYSVYVMTKEGVISRLDPNTTNKTGNPNVWYWKNNPTGCRAWTAPR
jgi:hypothetical protein